MLPALRHWFTHKLGFLRQFSKEASNKPPKLPIVLHENELEEKFVKGSGPGGQKINKCRHCVQLKHLPTGIKVETQRFRELTSNRKEARKLLVLQLDKHFNGSESKIEKQIQKARKSNQRRKYRAKQKYGNAEEDETEDVDTPSNEKTP